MGTIVVTPGNDGNVLVAVRRASRELELSGIAATYLAQNSLEHGLLRVADDVESDALAILNRVHIAVLREAGRMRRK